MASQDTAAQDQPAERPVAATPTPDSVPTDPSPALEKAAASDPTLERAFAPRRRWFADTRRLRRDLLAFFLPPLLLSLLTVIVVTLGSGLLLLGSRELEIGPIVIAWAVVAAALGVLVIGSGALWLATRATH
jgi:hypothetical protein